MAFSRMLGVTSHGRLRWHIMQGACLEEDKMLLITEFMDGGDLHKAISKRQISWDKRRAPQRDLYDVLRTHAPPACMPH